MVVRLVVFFKTDDVGLNPVLGVLKLIIVFFGYKVLEIFVFEPESQF